MIYVQKHLGVYMSNDCTWHAHIYFIKENAWERIHIMRRLKVIIDKTLEKLCVSFDARPIVEYSDVVFENCTQYEHLDAHALSH